MKIETFNLDDFENQPKEGSSPQPDLPEELYDGLSDGRDELDLPWFQEEERRPSSESYRAQAAGAGRGAGRSGQTGYRRETEGHRADSRAYAYYEDDPGYRRSQSRSGAPNRRPPQGRSGGGGGGRRPPQRKRRRRAPIWRTLLTIVLLVIVGMVVAGALYVHNIWGKINHVETETTQSSQEDKIKSVDKLTNILLVGEDAREGMGEYGQRSDSIILCTINPDTHEVILTSFMRDMYLPIPDHRKGRINSAFSQGGIELLERTIEENFDVHIDGYVGIDFTGFIQAIALLDGLEIELSEEEAAYMNEHPEYGSEIDWTTDEWNLQPGLNKLTPEQILAYSRMRHVGNSDWERTERQRKVIMTAYQKVKNASIPKLLSILNGVAPCITTDIGTGDLLSYVYLAAGDGVQKIESNRIPADGTFQMTRINGMDVLVPDIEMNKAILQEYINNTRSNEPAGETAEDHIGMMEDPSATE